MLVLLTRPRHESEALAGRLNASGVGSMIEPLLDIRVLPGPPPDTAGAAALLMTSANGVRAFAARSPDRDIPVFAVGDSTAAAARRAGFADVHSAAGDVAGLAELTMARLAPQSGELVHPAASQVAGDLAGRLAAAGYRYRREVIYQSAPAAALSPAAAAAFRAGRIDGVLLYSPRTGRTLRTLLDRAGLSGRLAEVRVYCLSNAVAETVSALGWAEILTAPRPEHEALLALLTGP